MNLLNIELVEPSSVSKDNDEELPIISVDDAPRGRYLNTYGQRKNRGTITR